MPLSSFGGLVWEARKIEVTAEPDDSRASVVFRFRNEGPEPVTLSDVHPSCGCTTAELAKATYAPGESGEIKAVFNFDGAVGVCEKTIRIVSTDSPGRPLTLTLRVNIPELFAYSTRLLLWRVGEDPTEKAVTVTCRRPIRSLELAASPGSPNLGRLVTLEPGRKYQLFVRPRSSTTSGNSPVSLTATLADHTTRSLSVFVLVR